MLAVRTGSITSAEISRAGSVGRPPIVSHPPNNVETQRRAEELVCLDKCGRERLPSRHTRAEPTRPPPQGIKDK